MGVFDRDGDGKTTVGEAAYSLEQLSEYEKAWDGDPHKDDGASCGGIVGGCLLVTVVPPRPTRAHFLDCVACAGMMRGGGYLGQSTLSVEGSTSIDISAAPTCSPSSWMG